jgi:hypothetical protein
MHKLKYFVDKYEAALCVWVAAVAFASARSILTSARSCELMNTLQIRRHLRRAGLIEGGTVENPYLPYPVRIDDIIVEAEDKSLKTFKFVFLNDDDEDKFAYQPGQFAELSIPGSRRNRHWHCFLPVEKGFVKFTVNKAGVVTTHLHNMKVGDIMGCGGRWATGIPWEKMEAGKNVLIGGGFAFTTLRSSIIYMLDPANRPKFGNIDVVYGARSPGMLLYKATSWWNGKSVMTSTCTSLWMPPTIPTGNTTWALFPPLPSKRRPKEATTPTPSFAAPRL